MTFFVYVNTSKQVGDVEHIKVFATTEVAEVWFEENDPEGGAESFWTLCFQSLDFFSSSSRASRVRPPNSRILASHCSWAARSAGGTGFSGSGSGGGFNGGSTMGPYLRGVSSPAPRNRPSVQTVTVHAALIDHLVDGRPRAAFSSPVITLNNC